MVFAALTALAVIALRLILFYSGHSPEGTHFMLVHFLALATIVFLADQRALLVDRQTSFPALMRDGFKAAALYALIISAYIWFHFSQIDTTHFPNRINTMVHEAIAAGQKEQDVRPKLNSFFTPFNYTSITFFTLLITGAVNALLIGALHHKVLRRFRS